MYQSLEQHVNGSAYTQRYRVNIPKDPAISRS